MAHEAGGFWRRLFFRKPAAEKRSVPGPAPLEMDVGPILTLSINHNRATPAADMSAADLGLDLLLELLAKLKVRATFHCPARMAESAFTRLAMICDAGHEIACQGYDHDSPQELAGDAAAETVLRCRDALAGHGLSAIGFHPPSKPIDARLWTELARHGFRYVSQLATKSRPVLLVSSPRPLVSMPILSNDSGYLRHLDDPKHVYRKHHALLRKLLYTRRYLALNYHTFLIGDHPPRLDHLRRLLETAQQARVDIRPFAAALPARYRAAAGQPGTA